MKTLSTSVLAFVSALSFSSSEAAYWVPMGVRSNDGEYYIDASLTQIKGDSIIAWIKSPTGNGEDRVVLMNFDCKNIRMKLHEIVSYSPGGQSRDFVYKKRGWDSIVPNTIGQELFNFACAIWRVEGKKSPANPGQKARDINM